MTLHIIQLDRHECEVPGHNNCPGTDWDHCIFPKNNRKPELKKFVDNHFNMLRACAVSNRYTKETDRWPAKEWLINFHMDGEYNFDFLHWILNPPRNFLEPFRIYNYIATKLDEERKGE